MIKFGVSLHQFIHLGLPDMVYCTPPNGRINLPLISHLARRTPQS